jgi:hypothetical protein
VDIVAKIRAAKDLSEALGCLVRHFAADTGTLHLLEEDGMLHLKALSGQFPPPVLAIIQKIPVGKGMAGLAVERAEPVDACNNTDRHEWRRRPGAKATGMEGAIVAPCSTALGSWARWESPTAESVFSATKKSSRHNEIRSATAEFLFPTPNKVLTYSWREVWNDSSSDTKISFKDVICRKCDF